MPREEWLCLETLHTTVSSQRFTMCYHGLKAPSSSVQQKWHMSHRCNLKFSSSHVKKGKKEQMKSILIIYFIEPHLPKIVPFQPVTNILKEFKLSQSLIDDMYFNTQRTSQLGLVTSQLGLVTSQVLWDHMELAVTLQYDSGSENPCLEGTPIEPEKAPRSYRENNGKEQKAHLGYLKSQDLRRETVQKRLK